MSETPVALALYEDSPRALMRTFDDFGQVAYDLVGIPRRFCETDSRPPLYEASIDKRRVKPLPFPAQLLPANSVGEVDSWLSVSARTIARLYAAFLVAEDPQRRLDARKAATLMHQVSLVRHILDRPDLRKVLIGDEVGLGKTIEAGLLIRQLLERNSNIRVLYLAPARLVSNVASEFQNKLDIDARTWIASPASDANLSRDQVVIGSIHKAVFGDNFDRVIAAGPWDVIVVDECHHLSDWDPLGGKPNEAFRLVTQLVKAQPNNGRLILMSGTPHQGSEARFRNILRLLSDDGKDIASAAGRVIFRTKDRVRDWRGNPLFPGRDVRAPVVVQLGARYERWYQQIGALYDTRGPGGQSRAAGWAKSQALQWAASSVQAGLGFLVRLGIRRLNWSLTNASLSRALAALRPYRGGSTSEELANLYSRIVRQIGQEALPEEDDDEPGAEEHWRPDPEMLAQLLDEAVSLIKSDVAHEKWNAVYRLLDAADGEKVVLFAQPVETVTLAAGLIEKRYGRRPAIIVGSQSNDERMEQVALFQSEAGPQFLISSRAGGEGLNMQRARRLLHLDIPWNPMELEQRIGRVHRFGSRKTIIVDTVVAAGSREVDMYRVAREKLAVISRHLDPEQFEVLFSRVMSLVPPKELETILGDVSNAGGLDAPAAQEIGRLVTEGFRSWSKFDEAYRKEAEQIRQAQPGEAQWADLGAFLVKYGNAKDGPGARFNSFEFSGAEIVAVDEHVPTVILDDRHYACGDTGGLPAVDESGKVTAGLGLNVDAVRSTLRKSFVGERLVSPAYVKRPSGLGFLGAQAEPAVVSFFLRQRVEQNGGQWTEQSTSFHAFLINAANVPTELDGPQRAAVVRAVTGAVRVKDPSSALRSDLVELEVGLWQALRRPTDEEIAFGVRYAVWPVASVVLVP